MLLPSTPHLCACRLSPGFETAGHQTELQEAPRTRTVPGKTGLHTTRENVRVTTLLLQALPSSLPEKTCLETSCCTSTILNWVPRRFRGKKTVQRSSCFVKGSCRCGICQLFSRERTQTSHLTRGAKFPEQVDLVSFRAQGRSERVWNPGVLNNRFHGNVSASHAAEDQRKGPA